MVPFYFLLACIFLHNWKLVQKCRDGGGHTSYFLSHSPISCLELRGKERCKKYRVKIFSCIPRILFSIKNFMLIPYLPSLSRAEPWHSGLTAATCIWHGCKPVPSPRSCFCKHVWIVVLLCLVLSKPCFSWSLASSWWQGSVCGFVCTMCPQLTLRLQPLAMRLPLWAPGAVSTSPAARQDFSFQRIEKAPGVSQLQGIW